MLTIVLAMPVCLTRSAWWLQAISHQPGLEISIWGSYTLFLTIYQDVGNISLEYIVEFGINYGDLYLLYPNRLVGELTFNQ